MIRYFSDFIALARGIDKNLLQFDSINKIEWLCFFYLLELQTILFMKITRLYYMFYFNKYSTSCKQDCIQKNNNLILIKVIQEISNKEINLAE